MGLPNLHYRFKNLANTFLEEKAKEKRMNPKSIKSDDIIKIFSELKKGEDSSIGSYLIKGFRVQISKFNISNSERIQFLYKRRRSEGLCIMCAKKVTKKNPSSGALYRLCEDHRKRIDKAS